MTDTALAAVLEVLDGLGDEDLVVLGGDGRRTRVRVPAAALRSLLVAGGRQLADADTLHELTADLDRLRIERDQHRAANYASAEQIGALRRALDVAQLLNLRQAGATADEIRRVLP